MLNVSFVVMPWAPLQFPSLAIGILEAICEEFGSRLGHKSYFAGFRWVDFLDQKIDEGFSHEQYMQLGEHLIFQGVGEWVFASTLSSSEYANAASFAKLAQLKRDEIELADKARQCAAEFVDNLADEILADKPDVVALTSTFQQTAPCLALAKAIKEKAPHVLTIMGGGNCDGEMGIALHENFSTLDFVVRGEGDRAFRQFLRACLGDQEFSDVESLCWRAADGSCIVNKVGPLVDMSEVPTPSYNSFFDDAYRYKISQGLEFSLIVEGARGCWWGQKHHCTFCGLNGSGMAFRSKSQERLFSEFEQLSTQHKILDFITADNIIGMDAFSGLIPALAESDWDFRIHYEVKSNLRRDHLEALANAGVVHIQPGVESLSSNVLDLMKKGANAALNVRVLRDCNEFGLTASWNILCGFPGECENDYNGIISQLHRLHHLQPPQSTVRIAIERFSPYFSDPSLGFVTKSAASFYRGLFDLPPRELDRIAYLFDANDQGVADEVIIRLKSEVERWQNEFEAGAFLSIKKVGKVLNINDHRDTVSPKLYRLTDHAISVVLERLENPNTVRGIGNSLESSGTSLSELQIHGAIAELEKLGLVFRDRDSWVAVAKIDAPLPCRVFEDHGSSASCLDIGLPHDVDDVGEADLLRLAQQRDHAAHYSWEPSNPSESRMVHESMPRALSSRDRAPATTKGEPTEIANFGFLYWRNGPNQVHILDRRQADLLKHFILSDPQAIKLFNTIQTPTHIADLTGEATQHLQALVNEGLALQIGEWALATPYRIKNWPIPYNAI